MKNSRKIFGIFLIIVFLLGMAACPDPDTDKEPGATVEKPTFGSKTHNSITINAVAAPGNGQTVEYAINTVDNTAAGLSAWQDGLVFDSLTAATPYYIFARSKANSVYRSGNPSAALEVTTDPDPGKESGAAVVTPTFASKTHNSITVNAVAALDNGQTVEYAINTAENTGTGLSAWQDGETFYFLSEGTEYYIFARSKANNTHNPGTASAGLPVTTLSITHKTEVAIDKWQGDPVHSSKENDFFHGQYITVANETAREPLFHTFWANNLSLDLSECDAVHFDLYLENASLFYFDQTQVAGDQTTKFEFSTSSFEPDSFTDCVGFYEILDSLGLKDGWNSVDLYFDDLSFNGNGEGYLTSGDKVDLVRIVLAYDGTQQSTGYYAACGLTNVYFYKR